MKPAKLALIALVSSILLPASFAHADSSPYAEAYSVGSVGSTTFQPDFTLNQQPYIYVEFYNTPPVGALNEMTFSNWTSPGGANSYSVPTVTTTGNQLWITLSQWNSVKAAGQWDTAEMSTGTAPFSEQASFNFKVNAAPEPVGTVLFLTGAFIMGISILRRNKALAVA